MYVFFGAGKSRSANKIRLFCFENGLYVAKGRRNGGLNNFMVVVSGRGRPLGGPQRQTNEMR